MSVQEKPRDKDKKDKEKSANKLPPRSSNKENIEDWLDNFVPNKAKFKDQELEIPENENSVEELLKQFTKTLPTWIQKPWMYVKPTHPGHLNSWYESWKTVILSYSKILAKHIINLYDLQSQHPFTNKNNGRNLSLDELEFIIEQMIDEKLAKWLETPTLTRIYYKTDLQWAEQIYSFSLEHGYAAEVMTLYELKKLKEDWSKFPISELRIILDILVNDDKAHWVDIENEAIKFKI